jgi:hypothetical protein
LKQSQIKQHGPLNISAETAANDLLCMGLQLCSANFCHDAGLLCAHLQRCCKLTVTAVAVQQDSETETVTGDSKLKQESTIESQCSVVLLD